MVRLLERIAPGRRMNYRTIFLFGLINACLFLINGLAYLPPASGNPGESLFKFTAFFSHFFLLALLLILALFALYAVVRVSWGARFLSVLFFSLAQFLIFIDVRVFNLFRFHLSGIVVSAMTTPGYWNSAHFSGRAKLAACLAVVGLFLGESLLFTVLGRRLRKVGFLWKVTRPRYALLFVGLVLLLTLLEKVSYGVSDIYNYTQVTRYEKILPLYRPLTFKRLFGEYVGEAPKVKAELERFSSASRLNYPRPGFQYGPLARRYNVVLLLVEGFRFDMLSEEVMPSLSEFGRRATVCLNHYSAGNTSRFGGFGLLYGLYGTYWHHALSGRQGPVLIKQLLHNDYLFKVMSSTELTYPEFNRTLFVDLDVKLEDDLPGEDSSKRDEVLVDRYVEWLKSVPPGRPFFSFLFLDSPHAHYYFKEEFKKFKPCSEEISFIKTDLAGDRDEIFNRYRNSLHYVDYNIGRIIRSLEEGGFLDNTVLIITGDHGEEFWERGYYGHNSAYTDYQTKVPLVLWIPGMGGPRLVTELTSHLDLPATLLAVLGDTNDPALYSNGFDILGEEKAGFLVLSGWDDCCLATPRVKMRFSTESYNLFGSEITDRNDRPVDDRALIREEKDKYLFPALRGMSRFLK